MDASSSSSNRPRQTGCVRTSIRKRWNEGRATSEGRTCLDKVRSLFCTRWKKCPLKAKQSLGANRAFVHAIEATTERMSNQKASKKERKKFPLPPQPPFSVLEKRAHHVTTAATAMKEGWKNEKTTTFASESYRICLVSCTDFSLRGRRKKSTPDARSEHRFHLPYAKIMTHLTQTPPVSHVSAIAKCQAMMEDSPFNRKRHNRVMVSIGLSRLHSASYSPIRSLL
jgi:hypothetical protein